MPVIATVAELEALYGTPNAASTEKEIAYISPHYRAYIEAAPFVTLATAEPEGLDCSPRGDAGRVVRIRDERTVLLPDRRDNNRIDSLRNIVRDPRVALLFLIPGSGNTLRLNGRAHLSTDPALLDTFVMEGKAPRSVIVIAVKRVYFQCARAILRADLWNAGRHVAPGTLPSAGEILAALTDGTVGGPAYDAEWPARAKASMW